MRNCRGRNVRGVAVSGKKRSTERIYRQLRFGILYSADKPCGGVPYIGIRKFETDFDDMDNGIRRGTHSPCPFKHGHKRLLHGLYGGVPRTDISGEGNAFGGFVAFAASCNFDPDCRFVYGFLHQIRAVAKKSWNSEYGGKARGVYEEHGLFDYGGGCVHALQFD